MTRLWILGSVDVEMMCIKNILEEQGELYVEAFDMMGNRVVPRDAATGNWIIRQEDLEARNIDLRAIDQFVLVELAPPSDWIYGEKTVMIDHHSPGSIPHPSIYQVCALLLGGEEAWICGAADHNLQDAYRFFPAFKVLDFRRRALGLSSDDLWAAYRVVDTAPEVGGVRIVRDSPSPLVGDVLMSGGKMGLVKLPNSDKPDTEKWVFSGAVNRSVAESVLERASKLGYETYWMPARLIGGVYLPLGADVASLLE